jgi:hypothetical protein
MDRKNNEIHQLILDECRAISNIVQEKAKSARYQINENVYGFEFIEEQIGKYLGAIKSDTDNDRVLYQTAFWHNAFMLMRRLSPAGFNEVTDFMRKEESAFKERLLKVLDPPASDRFEGNLQAYISSKFIECGIGS